MLQPTPSGRWWLLIGAPLFLISLRCEIQREPSLFFSLSVILDAWRPSAVSSQFHLADYGFWICKVSDPPPAARPFTAPRPSPLHRVPTSLAVSARFSSKLVAVAFRGNSLPSYHCRGLLLLAQICAAVGQPLDQKLRTYSCSFCFFYI